MNPKNILDLIENGKISVEINFHSDSWRLGIPSCPGWYFIETDTPPEILKKVGPQKGERHYNVPAKIDASLTLKKFGICILPITNPFYIVYSGETKNLKARAREHLSGHSKTGCLALTNYPSFHRYNWKFYYTPCNKFNDPNKSKLLRIFVEQIWRSKNGWPILCGK